ncbi:hypothetical protein BDK51DRAFT_34812, partial [Blyttiomyces helicus]
MNFLDFPLHPKSKAAMPPNNSPQQLTDLVATLQLECEVVTNARGPFQNKLDKLDADEKARRLFDDQERVPQNGGRNTRRPRVGLSTLFPWSATSAEEIPDTEEGVLRLELAQLWPRVMIAAKSPDLSRRPLMNGPMKEMAQRFADRGDLTLEVERRTQ